MVLTVSRYHVVAARPRLPAIIVMVLIMLSGASMSPCVHATAAILRYPLILGSKLFAVNLLRTTEAVVLKCVCVTPLTSVRQTRRRVLTLPLSATIFNTQKQVS